MQYTCIYQAEKADFFTLPIIIIFILSVILLIYAISTRKTSGIAAKIGICLVGAFFTVIIASTFFGFSQTNDIWASYQNGECSVAEGEIEDYIIGEEEKIGYPDRFRLKNVDFIVSAEPYYGYGYTLRQSDGGELTGGVKCKIYYIPYKNENVIMEIWVAD